MSDLHDTVREFPVMTEAKELRQLAPEKLPHEVAG